MMQNQILSIVENRASGLTLPALLIPLLLTLGGCSDPYELRELKKDRDGIIRSIERYQEEADKAELRIVKLEEDAQGAKSLQEGIAAAMALKSSDEKEIEGFEAELKQTLSLLRACQKSFRIKITLEKGTKFESLKLKNGKLLTNVVLKNFTPQTINLSHSAGVGSFPLEQMPDMIAKHYRLPPSKPISSLDLATILARKPDSLKTYQQIRQSRANAYKARATAEGEKQARARAAAKKNVVIFEKKRAVLIAEQKKKQEAIRRLQASYENYQTAYYELQTAYNQKLAVMDNSNIRTAASKRQKVASAFSEKGVVLRRKMADIKAQIAAFEAAN